MSAFAFPDRSAAGRLSISPPSPFLPRMINSNSGFAPRAPMSIEEIDIDSEVLADLAVKLANTVPRLTTQWAADQLRLPMQLTAQVFDKLRVDNLVEVLGQPEEFNYKYAITERGRQYAQRLLEISGYVGPAPISLETYRAMLEWQIERLPPVALNQVEAALESLVLPREVVEVAALAATSARSLFLFGPAGNGKSSLGRLLHEAFEGDIWIPYCICIGSHIIRLFDEQCHHAVPLPGDVFNKIDQRWAKIKRPLIVAGGEMTLDELDLQYSESLRFYEAPPHVKANGGTFFIDDFGRQRMPPSDLLNRWIVPMESQTDHLTLNTGQKIQIPFRLMLIVATNLGVNDVADPAFLRRMGYRLHLDMPVEQGYTRIFERYAKEAGATVKPEVLSRLLARYTREGRELRASEPRDLIERARDICRLHGKPFELSLEVLDLAWAGYFGQIDALKR